MRIIYLYPELKGRTANFKALKTAEEHKVGKNIQAELKSQNKDADWWLAKPKVFKKVVEQRAKKEVYRVKENNH